MPVESLYAEMDFDVSPSTERHGIDSVANRGSSFGSRSRSLDSMLPDPLSPSSISQLTNVLEKLSRSCSIHRVTNISGLGPSPEDFMNYLSREEQECILFFETTLDSLNDDFEDSSLNLSVASEGLAPLTRINSENDEIIDLVETRCQPKELAPKYNNAFPDDEDRGRLQRDEWRIDPESPRVKEPPRLPPTLHELQRTTHRSFEKTAPKPAVQPGHAYPSLAKPPGSVPTPMVIAQKIAEKKVGHDFPQPTSPTEKTSSIEKDRANPTSPSDSRAFMYKNPKVQTFPPNISISTPSREYNSTITKAAVKVKERKAQVLAHLSGSSLAAESDEKQLRGLLSSPGRTLSFKESHQPTGETSSKEELLKESLGEPISGLSNGFKPKVRNSGMSRSLNIHAEPSDVHATRPIPPTLKAATHKPSPSETRPQAEPLTASVGVHRTHSFQKPSGFRPQGITVMFSGRGPTDESRKEALRKLGLLRINEDH